MDAVEDLVNAKYHLAVVERMMRSYVEIGNKRFLVGIINEAAKSVSFLIRAFVGIKDSRVDGGLRMVNSKKLLVRYLDEVTCENLFKILEIARAQKNSPIEYVKDDKIILLIDGKYRILTVDRIVEFIKSIGVGIKMFGENFRQV